MMLLLLASLAFATPRASVGVEVGAVDTPLLHPRLLTGLDAEWHLGEAVSIALSGGWAPDLGDALPLQVFWSSATWTEPDLAKLLGLAHASVRFAPVRGELAGRDVQLFLEVGGGAA